MDRDAILESAHYDVPPTIAGIQCRTLSASNYALLRKFMDDSFAVYTVIAAYILAGNRTEVFRLSFEQGDALKVAAMEFGERVTVQELDRFAQWLGNQIDQINAAQTEPLGKPLEPEATRRTGLQATELASHNPQG